MKDDEAVAYATAILISIVVVLLYWLSGWPLPCVGMCPH